MHALLQQQGPQLHHWLVAWRPAAGDPRGLDGEAADWASSQGQQQSPLGSPTPGDGGAAAAGGAADAANALAQRASAGAQALPARLARCQTSVYSTLHATTLDDLQCQICLSTLRDCVALEPCGWAGRAVRPRCFMCSLHAPACSPPGPANSTAPLRRCQANCPCLRSPIPWMRRHNFCASCLSHHLAALLSSGQPLACPLRRAREHTRSTLQSGHRAT